jgi:hypothetical protein
MWSPGEIVIRQEVLNDGRTWLRVPTVVVHDAPDLLATYIAEGTPFEFPAGDWPAPGGVHPWHGRQRWQGHGLLMLQRPGDSYAIWLFWVPLDGPWEWKDDELLDRRVREGRFTGAQVAEIRAEGARIAADLDAGRQWWSDDWASWTPNPAW